LIALGGVVVAVFLTSTVLTAVIVTLLGDVVDHLRGARGFPTCRRAGSDLLAATRRLRPRA
jgi:hypothetical protein